MNVTQLKIIQAITKDKGGVILNDNGLVLPLFHFGKYQKREHSAARALEDMGVGSIMVKDGGLPYLFYFAAARDVQKMKENGFKES